MCCLGEYTRVVSFGDHISCHLGKYKLVVGITKYISPHSATISVEIISFFIWHLHLTTEQRYIRFRFLATLFAAILENMHCCIDFYIVEFFVPHFIRLDILFAFISNIRDIKIFSDYHGRHLGNYAIVVIDFYVVELYVPHVLRLHGHDGAILGKILFIYVLLLWDNSITSFLGPLK